jgi:predicted Zn-dependent peptidase
LSSPALATPPAPVGFTHRGLHVVYQPHPGPLTAIALSVRGGARFDGGRPGLAHLAEHMLFQGTASLDQITLNRRAAELGGEHNADTGYEDISLTFEVFNEDLGAALALLAEQYYRTQVDAERFRKERRVVMEEIRGRLDDPADRAYRSAWQRFFTGPLALPVSGTLASVRRIEAADVARFLRARFRHATSALAVVGGLPLEAVAPAVRTHFGHGEASPPGVVPRVRVRRGTHRHVGRTSGSQSYLTTLMGASPAPRGLLATGVALDLVGADPDSRLFQELRERLGLSYEVSATLDWGPDWAVVVLSASAARAQADRLLRAVEDTCQQAAAGGFTDDELRRARKKIRYRYALLADSRLDQALALAESVLWGFPTPQEAERLVSALSRAEVEAAWRAVVSGARVTTLLR